MTQTCIVIGASHAAAQLAPTLRQEGWAGEIMVISEEQYIPYHRPPLSKEFLAGKKNIEDIFIRPQSVYEQAGITFRLNTRVEAIDRDRKQLILADGDPVSYDKLALTVGSSVRRVDLPGVELSGIYYLRTVADVDRIKSGVQAGRKAVIVGGGYIGLETAAVLRKLGMNVTVVEMMERVLQRVTAPEVSEFYTRVHTEEGVHIICATGVSAFEGDTHVRQVVCSNGVTLDADLVIIGVGIVPNVELAAAADLKVDNGIVVDEFACTSDADIVAAGDCTYHYNKLYDRWVRLESVQNATDQARIAAMTLCGKETAYDALPWFWSDQYDLKLQIAGLSQGFDTVITRGDRTAGRSFAAFYLKDDAVIAVDAINKATEFMMGKRIITNKMVIDQDKLADADILMKELLT